MTKKWLILITILMLAGVLVSGCTDNVDTTEEDEIEETTTEDVEEEEEVETIGEGIEQAIYMEYYGLKPTEVEINKGDTLVWRNNKPQGTYVLVSDDGLFEDQEMYVHDTYTYTFTKSGTYTFSLEDNPDMTLTVTVN